MYIPPFRTAPVPVGTSPSRRHALMVRMEIAAAESSLAALPPPPTPSAAGQGGATGALENRLALLRIQESNWEGQADTVVAGEQVGLPVALPAIPPPLRRFEVPPVGTPKLGALLDVVG